MNSPITSGTAVDGLLTRGAAVDDPGGRQYQ